MNLLTYSLVVSALNLDDRNIVSVGLSRPIIAGPILGYLLNQFYMGLFLGALIELIIVNLIPIGTYIPPKATILIGIAVYLVSFYSATKATYIIPIIILYALFYGHLSKRITRLEWEFNGFLVKKFFKFAEHGDIHFFKFNMISLIVNVLIYFIITIIGIIGGIHLMDFLIATFFYNCTVIFIFKHVYLFLPFFVLSFLFNNFAVQYKFVFFALGFLFAYIALYFVGDIYFIFLYSIIISLILLLVYKFVIRRDVYE